MWVYCCSLSCSEGRSCDLLPHSSPIDVGGEGGAGMWGAPACGQVQLFGAQHFLIFSATLRAIGFEPNSPHSKDLQVATEGAVAEGMGFEPMNVVSHISRFSVERNRPLCQPYLGFSKPWIRLG